MACIVCISYINMYVIESCVHNLNGDYWALDVLAEGCSALWALAFVCKYSLLACAMFFVYIIRSTGSPLTPKLWSSAACHGIEAEGGRVCRFETEARPSQ